MARPIGHRQKKHLAPLLFIAGLLGLALWYLQEQQTRETLAFAGIPQAQSLDWQTLTRIFRNHGFMLGYSEIRQNPLWVSYRLQPIRKHTAGSRPKEFRIDYRTISRVAPEEYSGSGFDRGHLAPNYAIANLYGPQAQLDTFLMSNIAPQTAKLNQKVWQRLEEVEIDYFARWFGELWVVAGPLFDTDVTRLPSGVEIPDAFYKIIAVSGNPPRILAFIIPQAVQGLEPLDQFLARVDEIEARTGLDFFHRLDDALEERLESEINTEGWRLEKVARLPPRY